MRRPHRVHVVSVAVAALLGALLTGGPVAAADAATVTPTATSGVATAAPRSPGDVRLLPSGDRVVVGTRGGRPSYDVLPAAGAGPGSLGGLGLLRLAGGGAQYVVPRALLPLVGTTLDPALFDVARPGAADGRLRLAIRHTGATPALPGVTVTADRSGVATGVVTGASAPALGAALADEARRVAVGGAPRLLAGVSQLAPVGAAAPVVTPQFAMHTLVIKGIDARGGPARFAGGLLLCVSDGRRYVGLVTIVRGEARVSVPSGTYAGAFTLGGLSPDDPASLVTTQELVVRGPSTLVVDARTATLVPRTTVRAAPGATVGGRDLTVTRGDASGSGLIAMGLSTPLDVRAGVTPAGRPATGTLSFTEAEHRQTPSGDVAVDLSWSSPTIDRAAVVHDVRAADVATVRERHDTDTDGRNTVFGRSAVDPASPFVFTTLYPLAVPVVRTAYVGGSAAAGPTSWQESEWGNVAADDFDVLDGALVSYAPGSSRSVDWRRGPLAPRVLGPGTVGLCLACRSGDELSLAASAFSDTDPGHLGEITGSADGSPVARFTLTADGRTLVDGPDQLGVVPLPVPARATTYVASLDVDRYATRALTSTRSHSEWTFRSARDAGPADTSGDQCVSSTGEGCRVLPVLQARVSAPADGRGRLTTGTPTFTVDAGRITGAAPARVTSASLTLRVSGAFAVDVPLTALGGGRFQGRADLFPGLGGRTVDVTVSAQDSGGSRVTQTVERAYLLVDPAGTAASAAASATAAPAARSACATTTAPGTARCLATWRTGAGGLTPTAALRARAGAGTPGDGYGPADIAAAYGLDPSGGAGRTVAIVAAYDAPTVEADLATYRRTFGLPACTTANGCFRKVDQRGGTRLPAPDPGWALEMALDTQAVSAACPGCRILLVEGDTPSVDDLGTAVDTAVALGARIVSNSYGTDEFRGMQRVAAAHYTHPGVAQVVSSGDHGFTTASFPAVLTTSVAVGGTTLRPTAGGGWRETAWYGAGSGCSAYVAKPAWQHDPHCATRTVADVSAVADLATGLAVYDSYLGPDSGWVVVGGTSLSAPLVAGMVGLAGNAAQLDTAQRIYRQRAQLHDVVGGSNGFCGGDYLCRAVPGYDAPTGNGTPAGVGAL